MSMVTLFQQPWWAIKQVSRLIDEKSADMEQFMSSEEAAMYKNVKRMFPPSET